MPYTVPVGAAATKSGCNLDDVIFDKVSIIYIKITITHVAREAVHKLHRVHVLFFVASLRSHKHHTSKRKETHLLGLC